MSKRQPPKEAADLLLALADAAVVWWAMKRPIQWSHEQHFANPGINCTGSDADRKLAEAVAEWCRLQVRDGV